MPPTNKNTRSFTGGMMALVAILSLSLVLMLGNLFIAEKVNAAVDIAKATTWAQTVSGLYDASDSTLSDGEIDAIRMTSRGAVRVANELPNSVFKLTNSAAVAATATATQAAAGSGLKNCLKSLQYGIWQDNTGTVSAAGGLVIAVRDGAAGSGTIIWKRTLSFPLATNGTSKEGDIVFDPPLVGTANTAMTVEFVSAALAHTGQDVNAQGYVSK